MDIGYPSTDDYPRLGRRNISNALLVLAVPLPALLATSVLFGWFAPGAIPASPPLSEVGTYSSQLKSITPVTCGSVQL